MLLQSLNLLDSILSHSSWSRKNGARELLDGSGDGESREGVGNLLDGGSRKFSSFGDSSSGRRVFVVGGGGRVEVLVFGRVRGRDVLVIVAVSVGVGRTGGGATGGGVSADTKESIEGKGLVSLEIERRGGWEAKREKGREREGTEGRDEPNGSGLTTSSSSLLVEFGESRIRFPSLDGG